MQRTDIKEPVSLYLKSQTLFFLRHRNRLAFAGEPVSSGHGVEWHPDPRNAV